MNRMQKMAWFLLITFSAALFCSLLAFVILYFKFGVPKAYASFGFLGLAGFSGFSPLFFRKDKAKVTFDERDHLILRKAALLGFCTSFLATGLCCMIPFFVFGPHASISVIWLPQIWMIAFMTHYIAYSVTILIQYGREGKQ
jgi:hypothetical protein